MAWPWLLKEQRLPQVTYHDYQLGDQMRKVLNIR